MNSLNWVQETTIYYSESRMHLRRILSSQTNKAIYTFDYKEPEQCFSLWEYLIVSKWKKKDEKQNAYLRLFDEGLPQWLSQMTSATISKGKLYYWFHTATNFVWKIP